MKKMLITGLLICASSMNIVLAGLQQKGNAIIVPAGTTLQTILTSPISSEYTITGETVSTAICEDFYYNGHLVAPAGSIVYGSVIDSSKAKRGSINGKLCVRFNNITTPYGNQIPISGVIQTDDMSGVLVGGRNDVEIPSNSVIDLVLTQPATVSSASYYYEN